MPEVGLVGKGWRLLPKDMMLREIESEPARIVTYRELSELGEVTKLENGDYYLEIRK